MPGIRLSKLPDRTPVKLAISIMPDLNDSLRSYAAFYGATYGVEEPLVELIPHMLQSFLEQDRAFVRWSRDAAR